MGGAEALGGILDHWKTVLFGHSVDPGHVRALPIDRNRHDRAGIWGDGRLDPIRVHVEGFGGDIHEDRFGPEQGDDFGGGDPGVGDGDDLVARPDIEGHQGDEQRIRAAGAGHGVGRSGKCRKVFLEFFDFRSHDVSAVVENPVDGGFQFRAGQILLGLQIDEVDTVWLMRRLEVLMRRYGPVRISAAKRFVPGEQLDRSGGEAVHCPDQLLIFRV